MNRCVLVAAMFLPGCDCPEAEPEERPLLEVCHGVALCIDHQDRDIAYCASYAGHLEMMNVAESDEIAAYRLLSNCLLGESLEALGFR